MLPKLIAVSDGEPRELAHNLGGPTLLFDDMMISDPERIRSFFAEGFDAESLEPDSYDLRVGIKGLKGGSGDEQEISHSNGLMVEAGCYVAVISAEKIKLPADVCAFIGAKRRLSYEGIMLLTGMQVHPGYEGYFVFGLFNTSGRDYLVTHLQKLCSITFAEVPPVPDGQLPKADKFMSLGNFDPELKRRFADFKTQGIASIERAISDVAGDVEALRSELANVKDKLDDIHAPIKQLTTEVSRVNQEVETLAKTVEKTDAAISKLGEKHGALAEKFAEKRGGNAVLIAVVVGIVLVILTIIGTMAWDTLKAQNEAKAKASVQR